MRSSLALVACLALALPLACSTKTVVVDNGPGPAPAPDEDPAAAPATASEPSLLSTPSVVELGWISSGVDVPFDVPDGALGFNITIEGDPADFDPDKPFGIERITDPSGTVVHDAYTPKGGTEETSTVAFDTIASVSIPQGEGVPAALSGQWKIRIGKKGATNTIKAKTRVRIQSSTDGGFHGGKLDLHLHVPDGLVVDNTTLQGAQAGSSPVLKTRVDTFFTVAMKLLGFERGDVVFHAESDTLAAIDTVEELLNGFGVSAGEKNGAQELHVLFTNRIAKDGEAFAAGISPGIPGAAGIFGRAVSGIIVATSDQSDQDVLTMIHEAGHFFGLNHTTELDGQSADPLSDTPRCTTIADHQFQNCPDRTNIMFAAGAIDGPITLSPTQKRVYRGSPIYKAFNSGVPKTQSLAIADVTAAPVLKRTFRLSGGPLSPVETALSAGFCGLNALDAPALVKRYGQDQAVSQLRAAAADADLSPIIRGRARLGLRQLGLP